MIAAIDLEGGLEQAWEDVVAFAPKLLGFFLILLIGWFIAKLLSKVTNSLLERVGFDGWVERGNLRVAFERAKTDPSDVIGVVVFWLVFLIAMQLAFGIWGPNPISYLLAGLIAYLPNVIVAVVIMVIAAVVAKVLTDVLTPTLGGVQGGACIARGRRHRGADPRGVRGAEPAGDRPGDRDGLFYAMLIASWVDRRRLRRRRDPRRA